MVFEVGGTRKWLLIILEGRNSGGVKPQGKESLCYDPLETLVCATQNAPIDIECRHLLKKNNRRKRLA